MSAVAVLKPAPRMRLADIKHGKLDRPIRCLLYGVEGIGKSTFAAAAPSPIFIGAEDGTANLDIARFPEPRSWEEIFDAIEELIREDHDYKTVVIDSVDWAEPLCWKSLCARNKWQSIESPKWGHGYAAALDEWRLLLSRLENLRAKGMNIILLGHARVRSQPNPVTENFDRFTLKMNEKAAGLLKEWCDAVLFAHYEMYAIEKDGRVRGGGTGARVVHTQWRPAFDAKNRYNLPDVMPLDWDTFAHHVGSQRPEEPATVKARIEAMLSELENEKATERARAAMDRAGDNVNELLQLENKVSALLGKKRKDEQQ